MKSSSRRTASLILGGVGDALGYKNGKWEFKSNGKAIHADMTSKYGSVDKVPVKLPDFKISDDTVMMLSTGRALINYYKTAPNQIAGVSSPLELANYDAVMREICRQYYECLDDMDGRAPGLQTMSAESFLQSGNYRSMPFNSRAGGCGAAMRATPIGLLFYQPSQLSHLIVLSIESGRTTHNHPTGFLGSFAVALFTALAMRGEPPESWPSHLMAALPEAWAHVERSLVRLGDAGAQQHEEMRRTWNYFVNQWQAYTRLRKSVLTRITDDATTSQAEHGDAIKTSGFEADYANVEYRDQLFSAWSFSGTGGASGHDSPMIALDCLLYARDDWKLLCECAMLHGGDNDSTGILAGSWYAILYGMQRVPACHYENLEKLSELQKLGQDLDELAEQYLECRNELN